MEEYTHSEIVDVAQMVGYAQCIIQQEQFYELRRRFNMHHSDEQKKTEKDLHETHQKIAWEKVKEFFSANREEVIAYREKASDLDKSYIDTIAKVIEEEVEGLLLKTDSIE